MTATLDTAPRGPAAHLPTRRKASLNITAALDAKLAQMAGRTRLTKTAILEAALDSYYAVVMKSPDMTLGYGQVARPGDIDPKQLDCVLCEQPCHSRWHLAHRGSHPQPTVTQRPAAQPRSSPMQSQPTPS